MKSDCNTIVGKPIRYQWIDLCKTLGLLFVILGHGRLLSADYQQFIYSFHMPLFFIVSGILYRFRGTKDTLIHDFYRLIIPYILINVICLVGLIGRLYIQDDLSVISIYKGFIGILVVACHTGDYPPVSAPTWFIITLFFIRIILSFRDDTNYRWGISIVSVLLFIIMRYYCYDPWLPIDSALLSVPFVTLGIELKPLMKKTINKKTSIVLLGISAVLFVLLFYFNKVNGLVDICYCKTGRSIILFYLCGIIGTVVLIILSRLISPHCWFIDSFCSTISLGSLLVIGFNLLLVMFAQSFFEMILPSHVITPIVGLFISILILFFFYILTKLCARFFPIILGIK